MGVSYILCNAKAVFGWHTISSRGAFIKLRLFSARLITEAGKFRLLICQLT